MTEQTPSAIKPGDFIKAARHSTIEKMETLLAQGACIDELDENDNTALILTSNANNEEKVRWLLDHDAGTHFRNNRDYSAETTAAQNGYTAIVQMIREENASRREEDLARQKKAVFEASLDATTDMQNRMNSDKKPFRPRRATLTL